MIRDRRIYVRPLEVCVDDGRKELYDMGLGEVCVGNRWKELYYRQIMEACVINGRKGIYC